MANRLLYPTMMDRQETKMDTRAWLPDTDIVLSASVPEPPRTSKSKDNDPLIDTHVDHYHIRSLLGSGGMGRVYLGWNERLHRFCAIKILGAAVVQADPDRLRMFFDEARSAARLIHPNIVAIHTLGQHGDHHFIEMEYVEGPSLMGMIKEQRRLDALPATRLVAQIASALEAAHGQGVVHCDIKPDNVMLTPTHVAKLTDFGLARIFAGTGAAAGSRRTVGTPPYMAPELFKGDDSTQATDVYALGVLYCALLTGTVPYWGTSLGEIKLRHLTDPVPRLIELLPDLPIEISDLVERMMAKAPAERPATGAELVSQLHAIANSLIETRELVGEAMKGQIVEWTEREERFEFVVPLTNGRKQTVLAEEVPGAAASGPVLSFRTPCAPASDKHFAYVLELNSRLPFGAVGIHTVEGQPYFVMVQNHPRATVDPEEIRASVLNMAKWADRIEHELTGGDIH